MEIKSEKNIVLESHAVIRTPFDFHACPKCDLNTNHNIDGECLLCKAKNKWVSLEDYKKLEKQYTKLFDNVYKAEKLITKALN